MAVTKSPRQTPLDCSDSPWLIGEPVINPTWSPRFFLDSLDIPFSPGRPWLTMKSFKRFIRGRGNAHDLLRQPFENQAGGQGVGRERQHDQALGGFGGAPGVEDGGQASPDPALGGPAFRPGAGVAP